MCPCGNQVKVKYCRKCRPIKGGQPKKIWNIMVNNMNVQITTKHPLYMLRHHIIERCYKSEKDRRWYENINVCHEWRDNSAQELFFSWALHNGWKKGLTIDRIDSSKDYEPSNCRFITHSENVRYSHLKRNIKD